MQIEILTYAAASQSVCKERINPQVCTSAKFSQSYKNNGTKKKKQLRKIFVKKKNKPNLTYVCILPN